MTSQPGTCDDLGGEFGFDHDRVAACLGTAWLQLGDGKQAEKWLHCAVKSSTADVCRQPMKPVQAGARVDLASARLLQNDLDAAEAIATSVLEFHHRAPTVSIGRRVGRMQRLIDSPPWSSDRAADPLRLAVNAWLAERS